MVRKWKKAVSGVEVERGTDRRDMGLSMRLSTLELFSWWAVVPSPELGALGLALGVCQQITYNLEEFKQNNSLSQHTGSTQVRTGAC